MMALCAFSKFDHLLITSLEVISSINTTCCLLFAGFTMLSVLIALSLSRHFHCKSPQEERMQNKLIDIVFQNIPEYFAHVQRQRPGNCCNRWKGIDCDNGIIRRFTHTEVNHGNFEIAYLPSTLHIVAIIACGQRYEVNTAMLPRALVSLVLDSNFIFGTFNLLTLPLNLVICDVQNNEITGPIDLTGLPRSLCQLNLSNNPIRQDCALYANLPVTLNNLNVRNLQILKFCNIGDLSGVKLKSHILRN